MIPRAGRWAIFIGLCLFGQVHANDWEANVKSGITLYEQGDHAGAAEVLVVALKQAEMYGENDRRVPVTLNILGSQYLSQGNFFAAEPLLRRSLTIRKNIFGPEHHEVARGLNNLAMLYSAQGNYEEAEPLFKQSVEIWEKKLGANDPEVARGLNNLAMIYSAQEKYAQAESALRRAVDIWQKVGDAKNLAFALQNVSRLYAKMGRRDEADELQTRASTARTADDSRRPSPALSRSLPIAVPR